MQEIQITRTAQPKEKPADESKLGFGNIFTDHMFIMEYHEGQGWHAPRIEPYHPIALEPSAMVFHYAQEMFEGMKAYHTEDGRVLLFRPERNIARAANTCERLCIPPVPQEEIGRAHV